METKAKLSSAAWAAHDLGLAATIGGTLFGRTALQPALSEIAGAEERDLVSAKAWQRFSWLNLASHAMFASTWLVGRTMLSGREVSPRARALTTVKDGLIVASLVTGVGSVVLGRRLGQRVRRGLGPQHVRQLGDDANRNAKRSVAIRRIVGGLGILNLMANAGIMAVTSLLSMEAAESVRFSARSRCLP